MNAAIYCRVSTTGQAQDGTSLESQREACLELAAEKGYDVPKEYVLLEDWSGADLDRPKLDLARELIRADRVRALICYSVDRLARNPIHIGIVAEECTRYQVELLFVLEPLDNSPEGALIRYVKGYAAQIERERIKERTLRGKRSRARQGFMVQATGKGIYGYRYIPEAKKRAVCEPEAQVIRRIFDACLQGKSCYSIAISLNKDGIPAFCGGPWHPLTVKRILTNPAYKGTTFFGRTRRVALSGKRRRLEQRNPDEWIEIPGATPLIVSEETFTHVQKVLSQPRRRPERSSHRYLLTGYLDCTCGAPVVGTCLGRKYRYYRCRSTWPRATRPKTCNAPYIKADQLEAKVWEAVREVLRRPDVVLQELKRQKEGRSFLTDEVVAAQSSIRRLCDQEKRLIRLFGMGHVTEEYVMSEIEQIKKTRQRLENTLLELKEQQEQIEKLDSVGETIKDFCSRVEERLSQFNFEEKRLALQALQIRAVVNRDIAKVYGAIPTNSATIERTSA